MTGMSCGDMFKIVILVYGLLLLFSMSQVAVQAVELALWDIEAQMEHEVPAVHPQVRALMKKHNVLFFDYNEARGEFGFYRGGKWCPAR